MNTTAFTYCCAFLFVSLLTSSVAPDSRAQSNPPPEEMTQTYARPGILTQTVYIWGDVGTAGVWRVERNIDLVELLSAARLAGIGQGSPGYRQRTVIQVYRRSDASGHTLVYEATAEELLAPEATYPGLEDQDVIEVETRTRRKIGFQLISSLIGTAASLTLLILRLTNLR